MRKWRVIIKEVGNDSLQVSEYLGDDYVDEKFCVNWWGLKNPDVEWYRLEEIKEEKKMTEVEKAAVEAFKKLGSTSYLEIFKAGAEWQKKQLIDKACEWLSENCDLYEQVGYEDSHCVLQRVNNNVIEDFKKAMED